MSCAFRDCGSVWCRVCFWGRQKPAYDAAREAIKEGTKAVPTAPPGGKKHKRHNRKPIKVV